MSRNNNSEIQLEIQLTREELQLLTALDPSARADGGFQQLIIELSEAADRTHRVVSVSRRQIERIVRYATKYGNGGWERQLRNIFGRHVNFNKD